MRIAEVRKFCHLQDEGQSLMRSAMSQLQLSARAYHRILKLSRTISDLVGSEEIQSVHLAEALRRLVYLGFHPLMLAWLANH
jgi:magnesium chelatase family protein